MTGCSWQSAEFLLDGEVSDTTLRSRSDEWEAAGVFERVGDETPTENPSTASHSSPSTSP